MRFALFYHSLISDWNDGTAHFLRGVVSELLSRGHHVTVFEPLDSWSVTNLLREYGTGAIAAFHVAYPQLASARYDETLDLDAALRGADVVIVHEWNDPGLIARIGNHRTRNRYTLLFHDTHHRTVTAPEKPASDLAHYDGVLALGAPIAASHRARGQRAWTWHEAADVRRFAPQRAAIEGDLVWVGNWRDGEHERELRTMLIDPVRRLDLRATVHGVGYPAHALAELAVAGIRYAGWLPNFDVPDVFARHRVTIVPRRPYAEALPGIPTIRMFEALACGIPLISAPWHDTDELFTPGKDYLVAIDGEDMTRQLRDLLADPARAAELANHGRATILERHTCGHRVDELLAITRDVGKEAA